jgi:hypothetical protein
MPYNISKYTKDKAKQLGVTVKASSNPKKKVDVLKNNTKIATIGDIRYSDFSTYVKTNL